MTTLRTPLLTLGLLALVSCGGEQAPAKPLPTIPQDNAQASATAVIKSLADKNAGAAWAMLPDSYQQDIQFLAKQIPDKIPEDVWNKGFSVAQNAVKLLQDKKQFILGHPMVEQMGESVDRKDLESGIDAVADFLGVLVNSDIATVEGMRGLDVGNFVQTTGQQAFLKLAALSKTGDKDLFAQMSEMKIEEVKTEGNRTTLRMTVPGEEPREEDFVKVEGKWVPAQLADQWDSMITQAKKGLAEMPAEMDAQTKMQIQMGLGMLEGMVNGMAKAEDQDEFNKVTEMLTGLAGMAGGMGQGR